MAIGGVVINFMAKTKDAIRDVDLFTRSLDKADDELDTLDTSLGTSERSFEALAAEVSQTTTDMKSDMSKMSGAVREGAVDVDREADNMRRDLGEAGKETGAEFVGNIAEGIGSGQANLSDVVSGTLGGLTNLAATLAGPVGVAAGVAAAGIGLVFAKVKAEAEDAKARLDSMRGALEELGAKAAAEQERAVFDQWISDAQETTGKIENIRSALGLAGVTAEEFRGALAGDPKDLDITVTKLEKIRDKINEAYLKQGFLTKEQQATRDAVELALVEVEKTDAAVGAVRREQEAINDLQKGAITNQKGLTTEVGKTEDALNRIDGKNLNVTVKWKESARPGGLPGGKSAPTPPPATGPAVGAFANKVTINYSAGLTTDPYRDARILKRILEGEDVEQGRQRGAPLKVAW